MNGPNGQRMNPARKKQIRRGLLEALEMAAPYALEESRLLSYASDLVKPPMDADEQAETLTAMADAGYIAPGATDALDAGMREWVITGLGRNVLAGL